ncbi:MAG TPA: TonB-dependent receptor, partial [Gammaproteobacteria bacterium]|nr:TonB-dependent receptor [Gammaproteobacteria bacterium]
VNVITRRAVAGSRLGARAGAGRYATGEATGAWDWTDGTTRAGVTLGHLQSDGYAIREDSDVERGYERNTLNAYAEKTRGDWRFGVRHWEARGTAEYLGFAFPPAAPPPLDQDFTNRVTAFEAGYDAAHGLRSRFTLSRAEDDIRQNQSADFAQTKRLAFDWQNDLDLGAHHTLTVGLYRSAEDAATETFGAPIDEQTDVNALYLQDQWRDGRHTAVLAARATDHETFGRHTSWNADYGYALGGATRLTLGAGRGFRAPDATDLYSPFCGNPALEPEIARNAEAGLRHDFGGRHMLRGSLFAMDIDDLIVAVFDPVTFECEMRNLERARIRGLELAYSYVVDAWRIETEAIWQDPENRDTGRQLARRAERSFTARALRRFGDLEVGADLLATSARPDSDFSTTINAGYVLTNLTARYRLAPALALSARLENVFDTDYVTAAGYRNPGRSLFVALEYRGE